MLTIEASSVVMNVPSAPSVRTARLPFTSSPPLSLDRRGSRCGGQQQHNRLLLSWSGCPYPSHRWDDPRECAGSGRASLRTNVEGDPRLRVLAAISRSAGGGNGGTGGRGEYCGPQAGALRP